MTMKRNDESGFSRVRPLEIDWMTTMPKMAAKALRRPVAEAMCCCPSSITVVGLA